MSDDMKVHSSHFRDIWSTSVRLKFAFTCLRQYDIIGWFSISLVTLQDENIIGIDVRELMPQT